MRPALKPFLFSAFASAALFVLQAPADAANGSEPPAAVFYPLVGHWTGNGKIRAEGGDPMELTLDLECSKAAAGWAVQCDMVGKNADISMNEADLMGVDPVTGKGHWYAISDQGDAHDHIVEWSDPNDMTASYSWTSDGKRMVESISMKLTGENALEFSSVVTADGKQASTFSGKLGK